MREGEKESEREGVREAVWAHTDDSSKSERELQVQIPRHFTLALLGKNMASSATHYGRYGLHCFYARVYSSGAFDSSC